MVDEETGKELPRNNFGLLCTKLPLPPSSLVTLWNNDSGFYDKYLADCPGYYKSGDAGFINERGFIHIMSRTDDIINISAHRLSTGRIDEVIS